VELRKLPLEGLGKFQIGHDQTVIGFGGQTGDIGNQFRPVLSTVSQIFGKKRLDLVEKVPDCDFLAWQNFDEQFIRRFIIHQIAVNPGKDIVRSAVVVFVSGNQVQFLEVLPIDGFVGWKVGNSLAGILSGGDENPIEESFHRLNCVCRDGGGLVTVWN